MIPNLIPFKGNSLFILIQLLLLSRYNSLFILVQHLLQYLL